MKTCRPIWLLPFLLLMGINQISLAQVGNAESLLKQANILYSGSEKYDSSLLLLNKLVADERKNTRPDNLFLSKCLALRSKVNLELEHFVEAYDDAAEALKLRAAINPAECMDILGDINAAYEKVQENDLSLNTLNTPAKIEERVFFSAEEILEIRGDTIIARVRAGKNEGVFEGSKGGVLSAYSKEYPERGNDELGNCRVTELHNSWCIVEMVLFQRAIKSNLTLLPGDNVMLRVNIPQQVYKGNLYELVLSNIRFQDSYRQHAVNPHFLFFLNNAQTEKVVNLAYVQSVYETAESLYEPETMKNSSEYPDMVKGAYAGMNMWEGMLKTNLEDMLAFQRFVLDYPAKYMGRNFKVNETYATWLINYTPPSSNEAVYIRKRVASATQDELANGSLAAKLKYYLFYTDSSLTAKEHEDFGATTSHTEAIGYGWNKMNDETNLARQFDKSLELQQKLIMFVRPYQNDTLLMILSFQHAWLLEQLKRYDEALKIYDTCLSYQIRPFETLWYRGSLYYQTERYREALEDFEKVSESANWFASTFGMRGWILLKTGKFKQAFDLCKTAHEMDPYSQSWTVNYGHAFLMQGNLPEAQKLYDQALELITESSGFYEGIIADFDTFLSNGWNSMAVQAEKDRVMGLWNDNYRYRLLADSLYQSGKTLNKAEKYAEALVLFNKATESENKNKKPDETWLRVYERWRAYTYYKMKDYSKALEGYTRAYQISVKLDDKDNQVADLNDMSNLADWLNRDELQEIYRQQAASIESRQQEKKQSNRLFLVALGQPAMPHSDYTRCAADADSIYERVLSQGNRIYDTVFAYKLNAANYNLAGFSKIQKDILSFSRPGDALFFYHAGSTFSKNEKNGFLLGTDSLWVQDLQYWSTNIGCKKQLLIWDILNQGHTDEFLSYRNKNQLKSKSNNDLILISNKGTRIEQDGNGILSKAVIDALSGKANTSFSATDRTISAKEIEAFVFDKLGRNSYYMQVTTFSEGLDFPVVWSPVANNLKDETGPKIVFNGIAWSSGKRSIDSEELADDLLLTGQITDAAGVSTVTINNKPVKLAANGKFTYVITEGMGDKLLLRATDAFGNQSVDSTVVAIQKGSDNSETTQAAVNRALLFGTDNYTDWSGLKNPIYDVTEIKKLLSEYYGYEVTLVKDATKEQVNNYLDSFLRLSYGPKDNLLIFFAGHGVLDPLYGGHIVCNNSQRNDRTFSTYLSFNHLAGLLDRQQNCRHVFLVLDVCFGGGIFSQQSVPAYYGTDAFSHDKEKAILDKISASKSRMFLTSGGETYVSDGRPGYHSPFAYRFLQALESPLKTRRNFITLKDIVDYVRILPEGQEPRYGSFGSEFERNADIALKPVKFYDVISQAVDKNK